MAEEADTKASGRSRFLSKSKWGKVFKENDSPPAQPGKVNSFKLNEDVVDFLKPSTEKSTRPKIDIAIAQRWPEAHEVRRASEANTPAQQWTGYRKPRRRPGLTVAFVKTAPDIIGEGGDESQDPPSEVSRRKAVMPRSVSDRRPSAFDNGAPWPGTQAQAPRQAPRHAKVPSIPENDFRPPPVRRAQTSHNEISPPLQRKHASPPLESAEPDRPRLNRTPTGFNSQEGGIVRMSMDDSDDERSTPRARPSIDTQFAGDKQQPRYDSAAPMTSAAGDSGSSLRTPSHDLPPAVKRRQRDMASNEGMALRRASALYMNNDDDDQQQKDAETGFLPSPHFYNALSNAAASNIVPEMTTSPESKLSPESAISPAGQSPFADPKYMNRPSGDHAPAPQQAPTSQPQRQPRQAYQPSYMHVQQPSSVHSELAAQPHAPQMSGATMKSRKPIEQPSYMQPPRQPSAGYPQPSQTGSQDYSQPSYMRAIQPPSGSMMPSRPPPAPSQNMGVSPEKGPEIQRPFYAQPGHSSGSIDRFPPSPERRHSRSSSRGGTSPQMREAASAGTRNVTSHARSISREETLPQIRQPATSDTRPPPVNRYQSSGESLQDHSSHSSKLGVSGTGHALPSPYSRGPSPADYFSAPKSAQPMPARSPAANLRADEANRPGSSGSTRSAYRAMPSPQPPVQSDAAADTALADFASRVAHMKGVFRLTAEKERAADQCLPQAWLRAGLWWYLRGKAGLEAMLQQRPSSPQAPRELLTQPHVDLAKSWWIVSDQLVEYDTLEAPQSVRSPEGAGQNLEQSVALLRGHLKSLCSSMLKSDLMPPHQSLIQGQDTSIWLQYPQFTSDPAAVLSGSASKSLIAEESQASLGPLEALPIGDTRDNFCYGRFLVDVSIRTDEAETDRIVLPCVLSMRRSKRDFRTGIVIASQTELVNIQLGPRRGEERGLTWHDVSWKDSSSGMSIHLPRGFDLTVRMQERDFRSLSNTVEYSRKVEHSLRPESNETLVHDSRLAEVQYADSSGSHAFPSEKLRSCSALVFERTEQYRDGNGMRKLHRGYRLLLFTDPKHKSLSSVSHEVCRRSPLLFEFITDAAAHGTTAMVIRVREDNRQCRILLVFPDMAGRQALYDVLNGLSVSADETIVGKMALTGVNIQPITQSEGFSPVGHPALHALHWQKLGITNNHSDDPNTRIPETVESENLRIVARHAAGCITDRLNLGKGELLLRLPCAESPAPAIQVLRNPQEDLSMSIDTRQCAQQTTDGIVDLLHLARQQATIRTFTFATASDLHEFQASITGFTVRYDGVASTFGISHRMNMVPIYQKKQASKVRLQIVTQSSITQVLAFMEDFSLAQALCFQVKSTDTFESVKGDGKGKKWAVKMVDAKFSLPKQEKGGEIELEERVRRRFVNLEGLDYAGEHDDITVGFDTEADRDRFAQALPAAPTVGRGLTLKRRI